MSCDYSFLSFYFIIRGQAKIRLGLEVRVGDASKIEGGIRDILREILVRKLDIFIPSREVGLIKIPWRYAGKLSTISGKKQLTMLIV